jgi:hypothetical protein
MKKLLGVAFCAFVWTGTTTVTFASATTTAQEQSTGARAEVKLEELPEAIKKALTTEEYKDFTAQTAAVTKSEDKAVFKIIGTKNGETVTIFLNEDGTPVQK